MTGTGIPIRGDNMKIVGLTPETRPSFHEELDAMLVAGTSTYEVATHFGIRERGVRRRKASLLAQGHRITKSVQGTMPGANDASKD